MIEHEFQPQIDVFKYRILETAKKRAVKYQGLTPFLSILYWDGLPRTMEIPIPKEVMKNDATKNHFCDYVVPNLVKFIYAAGRKIICTAFVTEAWLWGVDKKGTPMEHGKKLTHAEYEQMKKTTKKVECIMISYETEFTVKHVYLRKAGSTYNNDGEAIKDIRVIQDNSIIPDDGTLEGRFTTLFRKVPNQN